MNRDLRIIAVALLLWGMGEGLFFYFEPIYLERLGADPVQIGFILGLTGAAAALSHIPAGMLADRLGSRVLLFASWLVGLVATGLMAAADALPLFTVGIVLYRVSAFVISPLTRYITASPSNWAAGQRLTTVLAAFQIGLVVGAPIGGLLADTAGLRAIYMLAFALFLLSTLAIFFIAPQQPYEEEESGSPIGKLIKNVPFMAFLALIFVTILAMYVAWPLTPNYLQSVHHISLERIGLFGGINALAGALFNLTLGRMSSKRGLITAQIITFASSFLLWRGTGLLSFGLGYAFAASYQTARWLATVEGGTFVSERNRGLVYGTVETVNSLVFLLAPPIAGLLYAQRPQLPYLTGMVMLVVTLILTWCFLPGTQRRAEAIPGYNEVLGKG
jgi:predicted MFS family arabinose efflux permease